MITLLPLIWLGCSQPDRPPPPTPEAISAWDVLAQARALSDLSNHPEAIEEFLPVLDKWATIGRGGAYDIIVSEAIYAASFAPAPHDTEFLVRHLRGRNREIAVHDLRRIGTRGCRALAAEYAAGPGEAGYDIASALLDGSPGATRLGGIDSEPCIEALAPWVGRSERARVLYERRTLDGFPWGLR